MKNQARLLLLKIAATLAGLVAGGCNLPPINVSPQPVTPPATTQHTLEITVSGTGQVNVAGGADVNVKASAQPTDSKATLCPCCGATGVCQGLCGKDGCNCSRGASSAAQTASNVAALPQSVTEHQWQQICKPNGKCEWTLVPITNGGVATTKRLAAPTTQMEKVTIYDNGSPAGQAMREAIGSKGVDWKRQVSPVPINGTHWSPTAVKPNGSAWTPGAGGWHSQSAAQFQAWLAQ